MDKLYFYSKSKNVFAGKGANEYVSVDSEYEELSKITDWRKILSNFHLCPFKYNNSTYNTIEHVFQSEKIALVDKEKAFMFTIESNSKLGLGDGADAQKNRKMVKLSLETLQEWNEIKMDVMKSAAIAKYSQCENAKKVLLLTNKAQLWHIVSRSKPVRFIHLEEIRKSMQPREYTACTFSQYCIN